MAKQKKPEELKGDLADKLIIVEEDHKSMDREEEEEKEKVAFDDEDWEDQDEDSHSYKSDLTVGDQRQEGRRHGSQAASDDDSVSHSCSSDGEESIDLDNLPEDAIERFQILGIDPSFLD